MAKARKQKPDGGGGATVLHQKLCLSIDMENQLIYGPPTLYGVPKVVIPPPVVQEISSDQNTKADSTIPQLAKPQEPSTSTPSVREVLPTSGPTKDADNISNCSERRNVVKIRVKLSTSSSKADDADHRDHSHGRRNENEAGPCSSMSVDAPMVGAPNEPSNVSNHNIEEQNSCHDRESRMSASVSNARLTDKHEISKELQCTADSRLGAVPKDQFSPVNAQEGLDKPGSQHGGVSTSYDGNQPPESMSGLETKEKKKKDKKDKKRNRDEKRDKKDDPEYLEKKRLKRESTTSWLQSLPFGAENSEIWRIFSQHLLSCSPRRMRLNMSRIFGQ